MTASHATAKVTELVPLLFVENIANSVAYYEKLGFEIAQRWETEDGTLGWCRMNRDGAAIMLQQATEEDGPLDGRGRGVALFLQCEDIEAIHAELTSRGITVGAPTSTFFGMRQIFPRDPDGYQLCFQSPVR
jgi:uncharacterized glyoxalase superfamily protein PhnB